MDLYSESKIMYLLSDDVNDAMDRCDTRYIMWYYRV